MPFRPNPPDVEGGEIVLPAHPNPPELRGGKKGMPFLPTPPDLEGKETRIPFRLYPHPPTRRALTRSSRLYAPSIEGFLWGVTRLNYRWLRHDHPARSFRRPRRRTPPPLAHP